VTAETLLVPHFTPRNVHSFITKRFLPTQETNPKRATRYPANNTKATVTDQTKVSISLLMGISATPKVQNMIQNRSARLIALVEMIIRKPA